MADYVSAGVVLEVLCYSLVRFPLICGAGLCSLAVGIWFRADYLDETAHIIRNTPLQSLPDAVDSLRKQVVESDGTSSAAFVVTRGVIVPADTTVVQSDMVPSGSAVYLSTQFSSTPLLASGFLGMADHDPIVHSNHQLVSFMLRDGGEAVRVNPSRLQCAFRTIVSRMEYVWDGDAGPTAVHTLSTALLVGTEVTAIGELSADGGRLGLAVSWPGRRLLARLLARLLPPWAPAGPWPGAGIALRAPADGGAFLITERLPDEVAGMLEAQAGKLRGLAGRVALGGLLLVALAAARRAADALRRRRQRHFVSGLRPAQPPPAAPPPHALVPPGAGPAPAPGEDEEEDPLCIICCERGPDAVLLPCAHQVVCAACSESLSANANGRSGPSCPVCRRAVEELLVVRPPPA